MRARRLSLLSPHLHRAVPYQLALLQLLKMACMRWQPTLLAWRTVSLPIQPWWMLAAVRLILPIAPIKLAQILAGFSEARKPHKPSFLGKTAILSLFLSFFLVLLSF